MATPTSPPTSQRASPWTSPEPTARRAGAAALSSEWTAPSSPSSACRSTSWCPCYARWAWKRHESWILMVMTETAAPAVAFATLGCKVNYSESEALARQFLARGYRLVPFEESADVYVVNTCTVTHVADRKSRGEIPAAARRNPSALVAATGCYASIANHALEDVLPGNALLVPNAAKDRLVEVVER